MAMALDVRLCEGLSDACRIQACAMGSVGRRRTSLRGGNRGPGWTGWCRWLWGFDGLAFGVDGGEVRSDFGDLDTWSVDPVAFRRLGGGVRGQLACAVGALAWP